MDPDWSSAIQYAREHNLFRDHNASPFSPSSCTAAFQKSQPPAPIDVLTKDDTLNQIQFSETGPDSETVLATDNVESWNRTTQQTNAVALHKLQLMEALLVEAPDFGPEDASGLDDYRKGVSDLRYPSMVSQKLPLLAADVKRDQGLPFPPHVDRLHSCLLMEVENEGIKVPYRDPESPENHFLKPRAELVYLHDDPVITEPPSPCESPPQSGENKNPNDVGTTACKSSQNPYAKVVQSVPLNVDENKCTSLPPAWPNRDQTADGQPTRSNETPNLLLEPEICNAKVEMTTKETSLLVSDHTSPSHSYFKDASCIDLQNSLDVDDNGDLNMKDAKTILDRTQALILPVPDLQTVTPNRVTTQCDWWRNRSHWHTEAAIPLLPVDAAREAALPWTPLPSIADTKFSPEEETLSSETSIATAAKEAALRADGDHSHRCGEYRVQIFDLSEDKPIRVYTAPIKASSKPVSSPLESRVAPTSPIKRRRPSPQPQQQQKAAINKPATPDVRKNGDALPHTASSKPPILAVAGDPGATSNLVLAFMALRGTKRRSARQGAK